jgi:hypothetical protein
MPLAVMSLLLTSLAFAGSASATQHPDAPPAPRAVWYQQTLQELPNEGLVEVTRIRWLPVASADKYNVYKNGQYFRTVETTVTRVDSNPGDSFAIVAVNEDTPAGTLFSPKSMTVWLPQPYVSGSIF